MASNQSNSNVLGKITNISCIFIAGAFFGAFGSWNLKKSTVETVQTIALNSYCMMQEDVGSTLYQLRCSGGNPDAFIQQQVVQYDEQTASILDDMRKKQQGGKNKR